MLVEWVGDEHNPWCGKMESNVTTNVHRIVQLIRLTVLFQILSCNQACTLVFEAATSREVQCTWQQCTLSFRFESRWIAMVSSEPQVRPICHYSRHLLKGGFLVSFWLSSYPRGWWKEMVSSLLERKFERNFLEQLLVALQSEENESTKISWLREHYAWRQL